MIITVIMSGVLIQDSIVTIFEELIKGQLKRSAVITTGSAICGYANNGAVWRFCCHYTEGKPERLIRPSKRLFEFINV